MKCLSAEELDTIDSTGLTCLNCLSSRKKRALQFSSQAEEWDPPPKKIEEKKARCKYALYFFSSYSEQQAPPMGIQKTAAQKKMQSRAKTAKAEGIHRKRTIEKTFSQHSSQETQFKEPSDGETESENEFCDEEVQPKKQRLTARM